MKKLNENIQNKFDKFVEVIYNNGYGIKVVLEEHANNYDFSGNYSYLKIVNRSNVWTERYIYIGESISNNYLRFSSIVEINSEDLHFTRNQISIVNKTWLDLFDFAEMMNKLKIPASCLANDNIVEYLKIAASKINKKISIETRGFIRPKNNMLF